jgi:tetratricopeptide (TPR) repeat protein
MYHCGEYREASEILESLIDESPEWAMPWLLIAHVRQALGDEDAALQAARIAVSLDESTRTRCALGEILQDQGQSKLAVTEFARALAIAPNEGEASMVRIGFGKALVSLGNPLKGIGILTPLAESDYPDAAEACFELAIAYHEAWVTSDRSDDAQLKLCRDAFLRVTELDSTNPLGWTGAGVSAAELGNHAEALIFFDRGKDLGEPIKFLGYWQAISLVNVGRFTEAIRAALASNDDGWDSPIDNLATVAVAITGAGFANHEDLLNDLRDHITDAPQIANAWFAYEWRRGDLDAAQKLLHEAIEHWPDDTVLLRNAMLIAAARQDVASATEYFQGLEVADATLAKEWAPGLGTALKSRDRLQLKAALKQFSETAFANHDALHGNQDSLLRDMLTNTASVRFEEQVAARLKGDRQYVDIVVSWKPDFLHGKEIDIWATGTGKSAVVSCKLRLGPGKPLTKSEVESLIKKRDAVRRECGSASDPIAGIVVTNDAEADADAIALASAEDVELLRANLSRGFPQDPRWTVVRLSPIGP